MKILEGRGKTTNCKKCGGVICSNDKRYQVAIGVYCVGCGRVDSLYFGFRRWLKRCYGV